MKNIVLVTENDRVAAFFQPLRRSRTYCFTVMSYSEWRSSGEEAFCYFDVSSLKRRQLDSEIRALRNRDLPWGIVDPDGTVEDMAAMFHRGAGDFIDLRRDLTFRVNRVRRAVEFYHSTRKQGDLPADSHNKSPCTPPPGKIRLKKLAPPSISWDRVKENGEYSFSFLYVELLPSGEWKGKSGDFHKEQMQTAFHDAISRRADDFDGRVWMWNEWTGLVLFPFDGKKCDAGVLGVRLLLNRVLLSLEGGDFQTVLNYKLALHIGSTLYRERGRTGTIVSDDVNFIFHLGVKKTEANSLYLSDTAHSMISQRLHSLFHERGDFEGHGTYRMVSPFPGAG